MTRREERWDRETKQRARLRTNGHDALTCPVCGERGFKHLAGHVVRRHKMSLESFLIAYPGYPTVSPTARLVYAAILEDRQTVAGFERHWTRERCVAAIRRFARRNGRAPQQRDFKRMAVPEKAPARAKGGYVPRRKTYPHPSTVVNIFGSFDVAVGEAGLVPEPRVLQTCRRGHPWVDPKVGSDGRRECRRCAQDAEIARAGARPEVQCPMCGRSGFRMLAMHLKKSHGLSLEEAVKTFPQILDGGTCRNGHPLRDTTFVDHEPRCTSCKRDSDARYYQGHRMSVRARQAAYRQAQGV